VRDRCNGSTSRYDISTGGDAGNLHTSGVAFSAGTARYVTYHSTASNLVLGDTNGVNDIFVRDRANAVAPLADLKVAVAGRQVTADASASGDADAGIASGSISFGDGTAAVAGISATHQYAQPGTFTVTATVTDLDGLTATAIQTVVIVDAPTTTPIPLLPTVRLTKPILTKASLAPATFAVVAIGKKPGVANGIPHGSTLMITVSQKALLTMSFERMKKGHRKRGSCSASATTGAKCTLYTAVGGKPTAQLKAGANKLQVTGRTSRGALAPGSYRLTLVATGPSGLVSVARRLTVTILSASVVKK
jgi:hypothetical protein